LLAPYTDNVDFIRHDSRNIIIIIIIGVHWTRDKILCIQIIIVWTLLCNETSVVDYSKLCQVWLQNSEQFCAVTTSGSEVHGFTTRPAKLNILTSSRDCCACIFNKWPCFLLSDNFSYSTLTEGILGMWRSSHSNLTTFELQTFLADSKFVEYISRPVFVFKSQSTYDFCCCQLNIQWNAEDNSICWMC